jgi:uncharacterized protein (TIGR02118 family)
MIKVSVLYPTGEGKTFDMAYYVSTHMPLGGKLLGAKYEVDQGLMGGAPGSPPPFMAMGHFFFDSIEGFATALTPEVSEQLMADVPNYTNAEPVFQVSEVMG